MRRAYYHGVCSEDPHQNQMKYENHVNYGEIKIGQIFAVRTLLDNVTCTKFISQNSIRFTE